MVSWAASRHRLSLGEQDTTTGWYKEQWTTEAITCAIFPKGSSKLLAFAGSYCRLDAVGYTKYDTREDDVLLQNSTWYRIVGKPKPWGTGDTISYMELQLQVIPTFPVPMTDPIPPPSSSHFWGFELFDDGTGFGPEFERGWK